MKNPRNLLWFIPLLIWLTNPLWKPPLTTFLAPRGDFRIGHPLVAVKDKHNFIMDEIIITITNQGRKKWNIKAEQAYTGDIDGQLGLIRIHALYKGKRDGREGEAGPVIITSERGSYCMDKQHLILKGNVLLQKPELGKELRTERLHHYYPEKMLISPTPVVITGSGFSLHAGRMDYDLATNGYEFSDRIKLQL